MQGSCGLLTKHLYKKFQSCRLTQSHMGLLGRRGHPELQSSKGRKCCLSVPLRHTKYNCVRMHQVQIGRHETEWWEVGDQKSTVVVGVARP